MAREVRRVEYYYTTVQDRPGEALRFLSALDQLGINMLALTAIPVGMLQTQLSIFPDDPARLREQGRQSGFDLEGPHHALLVQGEDSPGALVSVHEKLHQAGVNVYASTGVASKEKSYGYILYIRPEEFDRACEALDV
jgi:hypothetical protein